MKNVEHSSNCIFSLTTHLTVVFLLVSIWSCAWSINHQDEFTITQKGIKNLIETNMSLDEFAGKNIPYAKVKPPFQKPHSSFYDADQIGIQFETLNENIILIWFFSEKNRSLKLFMPKENAVRNLSSISASDIIKNFGKVKKYVGEYPPKGKREAVWAKCRSFGILTNTIDYPDTPFHFGLNPDDTLSYITVSD